MNKLALVVFIIAVSPAVFAAESPSEYSSLEFTAGKFGVGDPDDGDPATLGISYHGKPMTRFHMRPGIGVQLADDGTRYIYVDMQNDFRLNDDWLFTFSSGPGYFRAGDELDLGYDLEFRTALTLARRLASGKFVGLTFAHVSNASLGKHNPGSNLLLLSFSLQL